MPPHSDAAATIPGSPAGSHRARPYYMAKEKRADRMARSVLAITLLTSFYVQVEPAPTDIFACIFIILAVVSGASKRSARYTQLPLLLATTFLASLALSSFFIAGVFEEAMRSAAIDIYLWILMVVLVMYVSNDPETRVDMIMRWWVIAGTLAAFITLLAQLHILPGWENYYRDEWLERLRGTFKDPNVFGPYLVPPAFFAMYHLMTSRKYRMLYLIALAFCLYGVVAPLSRGAWGNMIVASAVTGGLLVLRSDLRNTLRFVAVGAVGLVGMILFFVLNPIDIADTALGSRSTLQDYDSHRLEVILLSIDMIGRHPLGVGPYQSEVYFPGTNAHNLFVAKTFEAGILAGVSLIFLSILAFWRSFDAWMKTKNAIHAILFGCLSGWFINSLVIYSHHWRHTFVIIALCLIPPMYSGAERVRTRRKLRPGQASTTSRRLPRARLDERGMGAAAGPTSDDGDTPAT